VVKRTKTPSSIGKCVPFRSEVLIIYGDVYPAVGTASSLEMSGLKSAQLQTYAAMTLLVYGFQKL